MCLLPYAADRLYGAGIGIERHNRRLPGSVRTRFSDRKPQTHSYAPLSPVLHFNQARGDLVGGNFWDMRATGRRLGNPQPSKRKGPSSTQWKWPFRTLPVPSIGLPAALPRII